MERTEAHAWGKVILLGEHGVVHGRPALAGALERGVRAVAEPAAAGAGPRLSVPEWGVDCGPGEEGDLARAFAAVLGALGLEGAPLQVTASPEIPPGAGLGCSAALGVAIARALGGAAGRPLSTAEASDAALAWERVVHGNPSGVDNALAAAGGVAMFRRGEPLMALAPARRLVLAVGDSGRAGSTREMVEAVARMRERKPAAVDEVFDGMAALVESGARAVVAGDLPLLGRLFDLDQALLASLLVSTAELEELCAIARRAGAYGAKLTGGGGGGCVIALGPRPSAIVEAWDGAGFRGFTARVGASS